MRLLVFGGTRFVGHAIVRTALDEGHDVTLANRGRSDPGAFAGEVERLAVDREDEAALAEALAGRVFDAVIDVNGYVTEVVATSARLLVDAADRYVFISTGSVYQHPLPVGADEDAPQLAEATPGTTDVDGAYGELKVGCERVVLDAFGGRATILRPGIVAGARDYTDRATWWVRMAAREPAVVVPDDPRCWVQVIDARDLATFAFHCLRHALAGPYNLVGPSLHLRDFAALAVAATGNRARLVLASPQALADIGATPTSGDLPMWLSPEDASFKRRSHARAANDGLVLRPVADTLAWIAAWDESRDAPLTAGCSPQRLASLVAHVGDQRQAGSA